MPVSKIIQRYSGNPILTSQDVPYPADLVFNAGVFKYAGRYVMVFRNDYGDAAAARLDGTNLGLAFSDNGLDWTVESKPCFDIADEHIICVNDPRLMEIDGRCYMTVAVITREGVRGGIFVTDDFQHFENVHISLPDNRNFVIFPEKFNGKYVRLDRPFSSYNGGDEQFDIWTSDSPDLRYWGNHHLFLKSKDVPFAGNRIGPGAPPIRTDKGWLLIFHAVHRYSDKIFNGWEGSWNKEYRAGVMLTDLADPGKIIGLCREPLMVPEAEYETNGFRGNVIFPGGAILEDDGIVKIYYGAADTVEAVAFAALDDLVAACQPV
ncbi:glycoside hydrolase family 130 protein [bacterium]|nr:glycoside hydrolase family 130 protein [bacterium]